MVESHWQLKKSIGIIPQEAKDCHSYTQKCREVIESLSRMDDEVKLEKKLEEYFGCPFEEIVDLAKMDYEDLLFYNNYLIPFTSVHENLLTLSDVTL
jgi:hypothetical protein